MKNDLVLTHDSLIAKEFMPGYLGRVIHTERMTIVHWEITAGAALPEHQHPHEQVLQLNEGSFRLILDGVEMDLSAGETVVIPSNVPHAGLPLTDCRITDIFCPVREDFKSMDGE